MVEANDNKGFSKTCYYELLDVDRKADAKTILKVSSKLPKLLKILLTFYHFLKAYRKAALRWHPDKNREEDTTDKFQQI